MCTLSLSCKYVTSSSTLTNQILSSFGLLLRVQYEISKQSVNIKIKQPILTQSINPSVIKSINQSTNRPINQSLTQLPNNLREAFNKKKTEHNNLVIKERL